MLAWLDGEWDRPSRTDHYLMAIACEVRRVLSKKPGMVNLGQFLLRFGRRGGKVTPQTTAAVKSRWLGSVGLKGKPDGGRTRD